MITVAGKQIDETQILEETKKLGQDTKGEDLAPLVEAVRTALTEKFEVSERQTPGPTGYRIVIEGTGPHDDPRMVQACRTLFAAIRGLGGHVGNATLTHAVGEPTETAEGLDNP